MKNEDFEYVAGKNQLNLIEDDYQHAGAVLAKYNTRINRSEEEKNFGQDYTIRKMTELPDLLT